MESFRIVLAIALIACVSAIPTNYRKPVTPTTDQINFMQRYGYLEDNQPGYYAQYTQDAIVEAVLNVQRFGAIAQTGILDEDTIKLMRKKRCGVRDINHERTKRYSVVGRGWKRNTITYHVGNWSHRLGEDAVKSEIKRALDLWAKYGDLKFEAIEDESADIKVAFIKGAHGDKFPFDGVGSVLAHAFFPYVKDGGQLHFDDDEYWELAGDYESETTAFFPVALHELGHTLGVGHSDEPEAIMYPYYTNEEADDLYKDDISAIRQLYVRKSEHRTTESPVNFTPNEPGTTNNDYERHDERTHKPNLADSELCESYDTLTAIDGNLYVFKGEYVWLFKRRRRLVDGYPKKLTEVFPKLPNSIEKLDAVFQKKNGTIIFFANGQYWEYSKDAYGPYSLRSYEIPDSVKIYAAFHWSVNDCTYIFGYDQFWRYCSNSMTPDDGYPKSIARWNGIPAGITAAIQWEDNLTYFFKGFSYWKYDEVLIQPEKHYPLPTPQIWFDCPETEDLFQRLEQNNAVD